jgi:hypothetical protein
MSMGRILIGSRYFFSCYEDFVPKDLDELEIVDEGDFKQVSQLTGRGRCLFRMRRHEDKQEYIDWALKCQAGMVIGKFLVPEFCQEIGFTIDDLRQLEPLIARLDPKHQYEEIIYNAYLTNGDFVLTDEQRAEAYKSYKNSRAN